MERLWEWSRKKEPSIIRLPPSVVPTKVRCGRSHYALLTSEGNALTWGKNNCGQLGHGDNNERIVPTVVDSLITEKLVDIAIGYSSTIAVNRRGRLFFWGCIDGVNMYSAPKFIDLPGKPIDISVGKFHLLVLVQVPKKVSVQNEEKEGKKSSGHGSEEIVNHVYVMGKNNHGQMGVLSDDDTTELLHIESLAEKDIVSIKCGEEISAAISSSGKLYLWGSATDGLIPSKTCDVVLEPLKISMRFKLSKIEFGRNFSVGLSTKGLLVTWGRNDFGQLGRNVMSSPSFTPTSLKQIKDCAGFSCGKEFTIAWDESGRLYAWGRNPPVHPQTSSIDDTFTIPYPMEMNELSVSMNNVIDADCCSSALMIVNDSSAQSPIISYESIQDETGQTFLQIANVIPSHFVEAIISVEYPREEMYKEFYDHILLTFRVTVCKPIEFFEQLAVFYEKPANIDTFSHHTRIKVLSNYRGRVSLLITLWIQDHWQRDFIHCQPLQQKLKEYIERWSKGRKDRNFDRLSQTWKDNQNSTSNWKRSIPVPKPGITSPRGNGKFVPRAFNIHSVDLEILAKQISIIDFELYQEINLEELYRLAWSKENKHREAPNILAAIHQFNRLSQWVVFAIVKCLHFDLRVKLLRRFITLAQHILRFNNFSGAISILSALSNAAVTRLKHTWKAVGEEFIERFEILKKFSATDKSYAVLRSQMKSCGVPCVPYLGMFLSDLTFIEEGNREYVDEKINVKRLVQLGAIYRTILNYQKTGFCFRALEPMQNWIRTLQAPCDEELFNMSLSIEPRMNEPWPIIKQLLNEKHNHMAEIRKLRHQLEVVKAKGETELVSKSTGNSPSVPHKGFRTRRLGSDFQVQIGSPARSVERPNSARSSRSISMPIGPDNNTPNT